MIKNVFRVKQKLFYFQLSRNDTTHFAKLALDNEFGLVLHTFKTLVLNLIFCNHLLQPTLKEHLLLAFIDLQCDSTLKEKFQSECIEIFCITEYFQVCHLEKDGHETTFCLGPHTFVNKKF